MKLGMYIMAPGPISSTYFINLSLLSVCLYVYPFAVARQRLGKNASFPMRYVSHKRNVGYQYFPELLVLKQGMLAKKHLKFKTTDANSQNRICCIKFLLQLSVNIFRHKE